MKSLTLEKIKSKLTYKEVPIPDASGNNRLIRLRAAAINHRDLYIQQGLYPGIKTPIILGSDGAGMTEDGQEVIINPAFDWGDNPDFPDKSFTILGLPHNGTFAEYLSVPHKQIYPKPKHLSFEEAAALPLAGLTAYRALFTKGWIKAGQKVLISGVGGGVALFAFQFALALGAEVYVTSGSAEKRAKALEMGAKAAFDYKEADFGKRIGKETGGIQLIIDSAGGSGFAELTKCAAPGARIVTYGGTRGKINNLSPQIIFWKQLHILGTSMGNDTEFAAMLEFVNQHQIHPVIDSAWKLSEGNKAFARMEQGGQFGKVVLDMKRP